MKRLGLVIVGSTLAFTLSTSGAMAGSHPDCTFLANPTGPTQANDCVVTDAYVEELRTNSKEDLAQQLLHDRDEAARDLIDTGQDTLIGNNKDAIGEWDPGNPETATRESVRKEIEKNDADIAKNRTDFEAADRALSRRIDKNSEAIEDAIALSAAIPDSWLSDSENFAIAVGGGFTDGSTAIGAIGTFRINKNLSAYGGGSTLTDGGTWAAKGGVRLGW